MLYSDPQVPIVNAGEKYLTGMNLAWVSTTTITAAAGQCRDITNTIDIAFSAPVTANIAVNGVNGLDVGTVANSTFYAVWVIADSSKYKAPALQFSLSYANPTLPFGYDTVRYIGSVLTDGSAHILKFWQYNSGKDRTMLYDAAISAIDAGNATTLTAIDLSASVPPKACLVVARLLYIPASAPNVAEFAPYGSTSANGIAVFGTGVAAQQAGNLVIPCALNVAAPTVLYQVTNGGDDLDVLVSGYIDQL